MISHGAIFIQQPFNIFENYLVTLIAFLKYFIGFYTFEIGKLKLIVIYNNI